MASINVNILNLPADGKIVTFDAAALRTWLLSPSGNDGETMASDADISVDNPYTSEMCLPGEWIAYLLLRMFQDKPCPGFQVHQGVYLEAHGSTDLEGHADGGAIIVASFGGPIRLATHALEHNDIVTPDYNYNPTKTQLDAAVEAFEYAADAVNSMMAALINTQGA